MSKPTYDELLNRVKELENSEKLHKQTQFDFEESEARYAKIFRTIPDCMIISDFTGKLIEVNPAACKVYGYSREEMLKLNAADLVSPRVHSTLREFLVRLAKTGKAYGQTIDVKKDGSTFFSVVHGTTIDFKGEKHILIMVRDVSEKHSTAKQINESNILINALIESPKNISIFSLDKDYNYTVYNNNHIMGMKRNYGVDIEPGMNILDIISRPDIKNKAKNSFDRVLSGESFIEIQKQPGTEIFYEFSWNPIISYTGEINGITCFIKNITDRIEAEEALHYSEKKFRRLFESSLDGIAIHEIIRDENNNPIDYTIMEVNPAYTTNTGIKKEQAVGIKASELYGTGESLFLDEISTVARTGRPTVFEVFIKSLNRNFRISVFTIEKDQFVTVFEDITARKMTEKALKESKELYQDLYNNAPDMFVSVDTETAKIIQCNNTLLKATGYLEKEIIGVKIFHMYHQDCMENVVKSFRGFLKTGEIQNAELQLKRKDGSKLEVMLNVTSVRDENGNILHARSSWRDITNYKEAEREKQESEKKYRILFETMVQGVVYQDAAGEIISANSAAQRILGLTLDQMQGKTSIDSRWKSIHLDGSDFPRDTHPAMVALKTGEEVKNSLMGVFHPEIDEYRWINVSAIPQFNNGTSKPFQVYATFEDITERVYAEGKLKKALKEKEALLSEVLHRVKNNLQVISSLLTFQADQIEDANYYAKFLESIKRVESMAYIHEMLYQSDDFTQINLAEYIHKLCNNLFNTYVKDPTKININISVEDIHLDMKSAIPCGLLLNELISNSLKHAFPNNTEGKIDVEMMEIENHITLVVKDNGVGIPEDLDWKNADTLGLEIVNLIGSDQLSGKINLARDEGTVFKLTFIKEQ